MTNTGQSWVSFGSQVYSYSKNPLGSQRYRLYVSSFKIQIGKQIQFLSSSVLSNAVLFHSVITEVWKARKPTCSQLKDALTGFQFRQFSFKACTLFLAGSFRLRSSETSSFHSFSNTSKAKE